MAATAGKTQAQTLADTARAAAVRFYSKQITSTTYHAYIAVVMDRARAAGCVAEVLAATRAARKPVAAQPFVVRLLTSLSGIRRAS